MPYFGLLFFGMPNLICTLIDFRQKGAQATRELQQQVCGFHDHMS